MKNKAILSIFVVSVMLTSALTYVALQNDRVLYSDVKVAILDSGIAQAEGIQKRYDAVNQINQTNDTFNHGTKVFNAIKSSAPTEQHIEYYDIQVLNEEGLGSVESVCRGINQAIEYDVDIITMSLGFNKDDGALRECVERALGENILVVAASGDTLSTDTDYPAKYEGVISVAAIDEDEVLFSFSSTGKIDYVALGVGVETVNNLGEKVVESGSSIATGYFTGILMSYFTEDGTPRDPDFKPKEKSIKGGKFQKILYNK